MDAMQIAKNLLSAPPRPRAENACPCCEAKGSMTDAIAGKKATSPVVVCWSCAHCGCAWRSQAKREPVQAAVPARPPAHSRPATVQRTRLYTIPNTRR